MSRNLLGLAAAVCCLVFTPAALADVACGCAQDCNPCGTPAVVSYGDPCGGGACGCAPTVQYQTRTIYENQMVTEMRDNN